jgi:hypothetical protein
VTLLDYWKDLAIIAAGLVGFVTFLSGVLEYGRQGRERRAEQFVQMRRRFLETALFQQILSLLPSDAPELAGIPFQDRRNFLGFLEEVALMVNSGILDESVAHYMFGYYVLLAARSNEIWNGLDAKSRYWTVFRKFAASMEECERKSLPATRIRF